MFHIALHNTIVLIVFHLCIYCDLICVVFSTYYSVNLIQMMKFKFVYVSLSVFSVKKIGKLCKLYFPTSPN